MKLANDWSLLPAGQPCRFIGDLWLPVLYRHKFHCTLHSTALCDTPPHPWLVSFCEPFSHNLYSTYRIVIKTKHTQWDKRDQWSLKYSHVWSFAIMLVNLLNCIKWKFSFLCLVFNSGENPKENYIDTIHNHCPSK